MNDNLALRFFVDFTGDESAGMSPYDNEVTVFVDADPGGESGEFELYIRQCLAEWFDSARVSPIPPQSGQRCNRCHLANFFDGDSFKCWNCGLEHGGVILP